MPEIIVLIGLPGSGKSTWRHKFLENQPDYVVVSSDDLIDAYAAEKSINYSEAFHEVNQKEIQSRFRKSLQEAFDSGKNIIVDRTNISVKSRKDILKNTPFMYVKRAIVFSITDQELKRRLITREQATGKHIPDQVIEQMAARYDAPTSEEFDSMEWITS
jgi:tRNA uridine 5-carbamoylmethylation protein Kti12